MPVRKKMLALPFAHWDELVTKVSNRETCNSNSYGYKVVIIESDHLKNWDNCQTGIDRPMTK